MKPNASSHEVVRKEIESIRSLANQLNIIDPQKLETALFDLEGKIGALRSFVWNYLIREEINKKEKGCSPMEEKS